MVFSFLQQSANRSLRCVWRVDGGGVSVTIVSADQPFVIHWHRAVPFHISGADAKNKQSVFSDQLRSAMQSILVSMRNEISVIPKHAVVVIGEPWSQVIHHFVIHQRKTPFKISKTLIHDLVTRDMKNAVRGNTEYNSRTHTPFSEPIIHQVMIAGYPVQDYVKKTTTDIRVNYTTGFFDADIVALVRELLHEQGKIPLLAITTEHYQDHVMRFWNRASLSHGVIIDPTGLITDAYGFQHGKLVHWGTFPTGLAQIHENVAHALGVSHKELTTLFSLYQNRLIDTHLEQKISTTIQKISRMWIHAFQEFCTEMVRRGMIIDQVVWMGTVHDPIIQKIIHQVQHDTSSFPVVFGTRQVTMLSIDQVLSMSGSVLPTNGSLSDQDAIILFDFFV